jgi:hypothetical protein
LISPKTSVAALAFCKAILFDFGGTLDSDGEHWLDRVYALYETAGLEVAQPEIKRVAEREGVLL